MKSFNSRALAAACAMCSTKKRRNRRRRRRLFRALNSKDEQSYVADTLSIAGIDPGWFVEPREHVGRIFRKTGMIFKEDERGRIVFTERDVSRTSRSHSIRWLGSRARYTRDKTLFPTLVPSYLIYTDI